MATPASSPNPGIIFESLHAWHRTAALQAAVELDVFTKIAQGANTTAELARGTGAAERGMRILLDFLTIAGFLIKSGDRYDLTPDSATFLDTRSPVSLTTAVKFLSRGVSAEMGRFFLEAVRRGGTPDPAGGTVAPENEVWEDFARGMVPLMLPVAEYLADRLQVRSAGPLRVLDIAAGHGMYGITLAEANPQVHVTALDWPKVLAVAQANAEKAGIKDRFRTIAGDAFKVDFAGPFDLILLTNFLHHFSVEENEGLLRKVRAALKPGGRAAVTEFIPNDDRVSPPEAATFPVIMLLDTPHGDAYTYAELDAMFRRTGFSRTEMDRPPAVLNAILIAYT